MQVTILGCGASTGVPMTGGQWGACDPTNPRNRRRRAAILVRQGRTTVMVDAGPDLREQLNDVQVTDLTAVLITHDHADHCHGIDDLRALNFVTGRPIEVYGAGLHMDRIVERFGYAFGPPPPDGWTWRRPCLRRHDLAATDTAFTLGSGPDRLAVRVFEQGHGQGISLGFRFGPVAYSTDVSHLDTTAMAALAGVDTWIVTCLRDQPHGGHAHFDRTMEWIAQVRPRRAILTHMNNLMDYESVRRRCPPGVEPAHDGMVIDLPDGGDEPR